MFKNIRIIQAAYFYLSQLRLRYDTLNTQRITGDTKEMRENGFTLYTI